MMAKSVAWLFLRGPPPNQGSFNSKDSTEGELELDISSLASLVCSNGLGCLGYKYVPPSIVKVLSHDQYKHIYFLKYFYTRVVVM